MRPMGTGELIDNSLRIYRKFGSLFLRTAAIPSLLCLASVSFVNSYVVPGLMRSDDQGNFVTHLGNVSVALGTSVLVGGPLFLAGLAYLTGAIVGIVADWMVGNVVDPQASHAASLRALPRMMFNLFREFVIALSGSLIATTVILTGEWLASVTPDSEFFSGIIVLIGVFGEFAGIAVGVWFISRSALVAPVTILEGLSGQAAAKRSTELARPKTNLQSQVPRLTSTYFFALVISGLIWVGITMSFRILGISGFIAELAGGSAPGHLFRAAFNMIPLYCTFLVALPIWANLVTLVYLDRRIRFDGLDIEILGRTLEKASRSSRFEL
jgi:hypothetical protein